LGRLAERARAHFNEQEMIALVFALTTINAWNRLAITMRTEVGNYNINRRRARSPKPLKSSGGSPPDPGRSESLLCSVA
jgi:hypothetical protein